MNARKAVRDAIIRKKMLFWKTAAQTPHFSKSTCLPSRARKNFWRLIDRYPEIAAGFGFDAGSAY